MSKLYKRIFALVCAAVLLAGCFGLPALAAEGGSGSLNETAPLVLSCTEVPLYIDNIFLGSGLMMDSVTYVPLLSFTEYMLQDVCDVHWHQESGTATLVSDALTITLTTDDEYMVANDRYLYLEEGAYNINGTIVVPITALAKIFNLQLVMDDEAWAIHIDDSAREILAYGSEFYNADDLYWLSHVIYSESGNQPMAGMIGVGNVVLNRANDGTGIFRDTIVGVIFQPGQFDVAASGTIYLTPSEDAVIAAKLCLEGYNTVGESKWFLNPRIAQDTWIQRNRIFACSIASHDFYV